MISLPPVRSVAVGPVILGGGHGPALICGPCVIESREVVMEIAEGLVSWAREEQVPLIFKASFDKANRTSLQGFRGPGLEEGLEILAEVKGRYEVPILTDIHTPDQAEAVGEVVDVLQIPAFLCRQTDLLLAAAGTGAVVNVKKAQFLAPGDMAPVVEKLEGGGGEKILLTERGSTFGYHNLVVDMRGLVEMRRNGWPVIFDATHSVQRPGGGGGYTSGEGELAPVLARAAAAVGVDGFFVETHVRPAEAKSDRENLVPLEEMPGLWRQVRAVAESLFV